MKEKIEFNFASLGWVGFFLQWFSCGNVLYCVHHLSCCMKEGNMVVCLDGVYWGAQAWLRDNLRYKHIAKLVLV